MITVDKIIVLGGNPPVKLLTASGPTVALIRSSGSGLLIGNNTVSLINGFRLSSEITRLELKNADEVWAVATSSAIVSLLIQS